MKHKKLKIILVFLMLCVPFYYLKAQADSEPLFNGINFKGWKKVGSDAPFTIENGMITMHQKANTKEHSFLRTTKKYKNFILEISCKRDPSYTYGILFRAVNNPDSASVRLNGYQVKIDHDKKRRWTGGIFDDFGKTWNWMSTLEGNTNGKNALKEAGQWDTFRIEVVDSIIKVWLNGVPTAHIQNSKYKKGYIALKIHFLGNKPEQEKQAAYCKEILITTKNIKEHSQSINLPLEIVK